MAGNALIPLMGKPTELGVHARQGAVTGNILANTIENNQTKPMRMEAAGLEIESAKRKAEMEKSMMQLRSAAIDVAPVMSSMQAGDMQGALRALTVRNARLMAEGRDNSDTAQAIADLESGDPDRIRALYNDFETVQRTAQQFGGMEAPGGVSGPTAAEREFQAMTAGLPPDEVERARRISLGLDPRAMGSSAITIQQQGLTNPVAASQSVIKGAEAGAARTAQNAADAGWSGGPSRAEIEAEVASAKEQAKLEAEQLVKDRLNAVAMDVYSTGMSGLQDALSNTTTGPVAGRVPAVTASAQIAEGAIAAVAPVLKQMFRAAGEGVFTDRDQQLLLDMVPKRTDHPEAQAAKIQNIDAIVKAKLGGGAPPESVPAGVGEFAGFKVIGVK